MGDDEDTTLRDAETLLAETLSDLGLEQTLPPLQPDATISERTLAAIRGSGGDDDPEASLSGSVSSPLPRISIHDATGEASQLSREASGPDFELIEALGRGAMGQVYRARQRSLDREVAIKRPIAGGSEKEAMTLRREARVTGNLEHPNIVPIHVLGHDDDQQPLIVMKRIEGRVWRDMLREDARRPGWPGKHSRRLATHLDILSQICNAVAFAHSRGILHRDIKPENVMIGDYGEVYLLDWGLAARADTTRKRRGLVGTPSYMAPEMAAARSTTMRSDVYLLGATLHEILTGQTRHQGEVLVDVLREALVSAPTGYGEDVPAPLAALANAATARSPEDRPPTVMAFRTALADYERHRASTALCSAADERLAKLQQLLARPEQTEVVQVRTRIDDCRLSYRQALGEWEDNPEAVRGLRACQQLAVRFELHHGNLEGARIALAEISAPDAGLVAEVDKLAQLRRVDSEEHDRLRQLERDLDPSRMEWRPRVTLLCLGAALVGGAHLVSRLFEAAGNNTPMRLLMVQIIACVVFSGSVVVLRRQLLVNAFSRRLIGLLFIALACSLVHRLAATVHGVAREYVLVVDIIIYSGMSALAAALLLRWMWLGAGIGGLSTLVALIFPELAGLALNVQLLSVILLALVFWKDASEQDSAR